MLVGFLFDNNITKKKKMKNLENDILKEINENYDRSIYVENGVVRPWVCLVCDKLLQFWEVNYIHHRHLRKTLLGPKRQLHHDIIEYYTYRGVGTDDKLQECLFT